MTITHSLAARPTSIPSQVPSPSSVPASVAAVLDELTVAPDLGRVTWRSRTIDTTEPRDLEKRLGHLLYEVLHLRRADPIGTRARMVRDEPFEFELAAGVPHHDVTVPAQALRRQDAGARTLVGLMGVRVWVPAGDVQQAPDSWPGPAAVRLDAVHRALSPGFLLVHGPNGLAGSPLLRLYLNPADDRTAPYVWADALQLLQAWGGSYRAKVASVRWFYPRTDAITVYLQATGVEELGELPGQLADLPGLRQETSLLCRRLGPGLAAACEPQDTTAGRAGLSFGEHRASLLAQTVLAGHASQDGWRAHLSDVLTAGGVDPTALWRNQPARPAGAAGPPTGTNAAPRPQTGYRPSGL